MPSATCEYNYQLSLTNFNRRVATEKQVEAVRVAFEAETVTLDLLLDAQRQRADAEVAYFRSLTDYMRGIAEVHFRKGSILEYDGVYLSEGPWPAKAQLDAHRLARQRDASHYLDYGFTRPDVISRGAYLQNAGDKDDPRVGGTAKPSTEDSQLQGETVPTPMPVGEDSAAAEDQSAAVAAARETGGKTRAGFDWGSLGLRPGSPSRPVASAASSNQDTAKETSLKIVKTQATTQVDTADDSSASDQGVSQAVYPSWKSSSPNEAAEDQPVGATDRPATGWQARKR